jgi:ferric-dicitrate binding protein FerR (iron transport regulator)
MNDQDLERLLKSAGPRERPPAEVERAVRAALHAQWQAMLREGRAGRKRRGAIALAASLAIAAVGAWIAGTQITDTPAAVGTLAAATGDLRERAGWLGGWRSMANGDVIVAGRTLQTGADGRAAIALADGVSLRIDRGTRMAFVDSSRVRLERGALYLDSGSDRTQPGRLLVETPGGSVRHVGTQYELRLLDAGTQLRVREGRVEFLLPTGRVEHGRGGEQLVIFGDGRVERGATPRFGSTWTWISDATPALDLEGMSLARFLAWAGRELGRDVDFAGAVTETDVEAVMVHGSTAGLSPTEALQTVLATTRFQATVDGDRILVDRREPT